MKLLRAMGAKLAGPEDPASLTALAREAESFLRAGGTLALDDWCELTPPERAAFVAAGNRLSGRSTDEELAEHALGLILQETAEVVAREATRHGLEVPE